MDGRIRLAKYLQVKSYTESSVKLVCTVLNIQGGFLGTRPVQRAAFGGLGAKDIFTCERNLPR